MMLKFFLVMLQHPQHLVATSSQTHLLAPMWIIRRDDTNQELSLRAHQVLHINPLENVVVMINVTVYLPIFWVPSVQNLMPRCTLRASHARKS